MLPFLHLDRIYARGFRVKIAHVHRGPHWSRFSDHAALSALLMPEEERLSRPRARTSQPPAAT
jgi:endonuclease/exonuclease/phosphatase family metal-dependent hydrolase